MSEKMIRDMHETEQSLIETLDAMRDEILEFREPEDFVREIIGNMSATMDNGTQIGLFRDNYNLGIISEEHEGCEHIHDVIRWNIFNILEAIGREWLEEQLERQLEEELDDE